MRSALIISRDEPRSAAWGTALIRAGWTVVHAPDVAFAFARRARDVDLMVVDVGCEAQRALLARLCVSFELPPLVVRAQANSPDLILWGTVASLHVGAMTPAQLVCTAESIWRLDQRAAMTLPLRLPSLSVSKWTVRMSAVDAVADAWVA